jgi:hypothetical protein
MEKVDHSVGGFSFADFSIVIQRVGTKLPEIFDLRYEYLFRRQFPRVSVANEWKLSKKQIRVV